LLRVSGNIYILQSYGILGYLKVRVPIMLMDTKNVNKHLIFMAYIDSFNELASLRCHLILTSYDLSRRLERLTNYNDNDLNTNERETF
jgi:hypothetical protein